MFDPITEATKLGLLPVASLVPLMDWRAPGIMPDMVESSNLIRKGSKIIPQSPTAQWTDPARDTRAQLYQDKGFTWNWAGGATNGQSYEIARFKSGHGGNGFVKYVGTFIKILDGGAPVDLDFSDPYTIQNNGVDIRFRLQLHAGRLQNMGVAPWSGDVALTPGVPYSPLSYWDDYRFYWGRYANHVWFLIPRYHYLRLFVEVITGGTNLTQALGRLQGYTQPATTLPAVENVQHGW